MSLANSWYDEDYTGKRLNSRCIRVSLWWPKQLTQTTWRKKRFILAYDLRGLSPWSAGSIALGLRWGRISWQKGTAEENCSAHGGLEAGLRQDTMLKGTPPVIYFLQPGPILLHTVPFKLLIHWWGPCCFIFQSSWEGGSLYQIVAGDFDHTALHSHSWSMIASAFFPSAGLVAKINGPCLTPSYMWVFLFLFRYLLSLLTIWIAVGHIQAHPTCLYLQYLKLQLCTVSMSG